MLASGQLCSAAQPATQPGMSSGERLWTDGPCMPSIAELINWFTTWRSGRPCVWCVRRCRI